MGFPPHDSNVDCRFQRPVCCPLHQGERDRRERTKTPAERELKLGNGREQVNHRETLPEVPGSSHASVRFQIGDGRECFGSPASEAGHIQLGGGPIAGLFIREDAKTQGPTPGQQRQRGTAIPQHSRDLAEAGHSLPSTAREVVFGQLGDPLPASQCLQRKSRCWRTVAIPPLRRDPPERLARRHWRPGGGQPGWGAAEAAEASAAARPGPTRARRATRRERTERRSPARHRARAARRGRVALRAGGSERAAWRRHRSSPHPALRQQESVCGAGCRLLAGDGPRKRTAPRRGRTGCARVALGFPRPRPATGCLPLPSGSRACRGARSRKTGFRGSESRMPRERERRAGG